MPPTPPTPPTNTRDPLLVPGPPGRRADRVQLDEVRALPLPDLIARAKIGVENFDRRVLGLDHAQLDTAFRADAGLGRWPCRVLLGHLADAELVFVHRLRKVAAEEGPILAAWDEDAFIDSGLYGSPESGSKFPIAAFVATIHTLRQWTTEWLATLPPATFDRTGLHAERGPQSLRTILDYTVWHIEHHAWYLNRKVDRLAAPESTQ